MYGLPLRCNSVGTVGADNLRSFMRESVLEKVDEFSNDYLAVNAAP